MKNFVVIFLCVGTVVSIPIETHFGINNMGGEVAAGCTYNGVMYSQGQQWYVGCDLVCVCENGDTGSYSCTDRCIMYDLPKGCTIKEDPNDVCCKVPYCDPVQSTYTPPL